MDGQVKIKVVEALRTMSKDQFDIAVCSSYFAFLRSKAYPSPSTNSRGVEVTPNYISIADYQETEGLTYTMFASNH